MAKARLGFKLASTVKVNKMAFFRYINSQRRMRDNIGLLLEEVSPLTNREADKAEAFHAFFASVFSTGAEPWNPLSPVVEGRDWGG